MVIPKGSEATVHYYRSWEGIEEGGDYWKWEIDGNLDFSHFVINTVLRRRFGRRANRGVDVASMVEMKSLTESWPVASFGWVSGLPSRTSAFAPGSRQ